MTSTPSTKAELAAKLSDVSASHYDDPLRLAKEFVQAHYLRNGELTLYNFRDKWQSWNGLSWEELDTRVLESQITSFVAERFRACASDNKPPQRMSTRITSGVLKFLGDTCVLPATQEWFSWLDDPEGLADRNYITFLNGVLHVPSYLKGEDGAFQRHTPAWFSPVHLSYDFEPEAKCPLWLNFLDEVLGQQDKDLVLLVQEMFGYCLLPDTQYEKFFLLQGYGRNGKSTVAALLTHMLDKKNVSHVSLESFVDKFAIIATENKLVNIMAEVTKVPALVEGVFKEYVSGQPIAARNLFERMFSMRPTARCVCTSNPLPPVKDHSNGFWRRLALIPFTYTVPEDKIDTKLEQKLCTELPGIALWALHGLERLYAQNGFTQPKAAQRAIGAYREANNPLGTFIQETLEEAPLDEEMSLKTLIGMYTASYREEDKTLELPGQADVLRELRAAFPRCKDVRKFPMGEEVKQRFIKGVRVKST
jgi:P4 family phage/plasmid primase-like protien